MCVCVCVCVSVSVSVCDNAMNDYNGIGTVAILMNSKLNSYG